MKTADFDGRRFQLWRYGVSHSMLLLMSPMDEGCHSRICILFKGVRHIDLPQLFTVQDIREHAVAGGAHKRFEIVTDNKSFEVTALAMFIEEDTLAHIDETIFDRVMG